MAGPGKAAVRAFSIPLYDGEGGRGGRDVNCVALPLNCLLVVLITALIDAEIEKKKLLPRARRRAKDSGGWRIKDYHSEHMEMAAL